MSSARFKYSWRIYASVYIVIVIAPLTAYLGFVALAQRLPLFGAVFVFTAIFFLYVFIAIHLRFSEIRTDETGISAWRFGLRWDRLSWSQIRKVVKATYPEPYSTSPSERTSIFMADSDAKRSFRFLVLLRNKGGGVLSFEDRIEDFAELLRFINEKAAAHGTEIVAIDLMAAARIATSRWGKLEPRPTEQKINRL